MLVNKQSHYWSIKYRTYFKILKNWVDNFYFLYDSVDINGYLSAPSMLLSLKGPNLPLHYLGCLIPPTNRGLPLVFFSTDDASIWRSIRMYLYVTKFPKGHLLENSMNMRKMNCRTKILRCFLCLSPLTYLICTYKKLYITSLVLSRLVSNFPVGPEEVVDFAKKKIFMDNVSFC